MFSIQARLLFRRWLERFRAAAALEELGAVDIQIAVGVAVNVYRSAVLCRNQRATGRGQAGDCLHDARHVIRRIRIPRGLEHVVG
jgi:hypothetical protein